MEYIIGIDTGTTNTKAVALSADGVMLAEYSLPAESLTGLPAGYHEQDPHKLFDIFIRVLSAILEKTRSHELKGICLSSAMHSLIAVDDKGRPLTNVMTWADLRSIEYAQELKNNGKGDSIFRRTGAPIHPMLPLCKIMWLKEYCPEVYLSAAKYIGIKEFFIHQLFGKYIVDHSIASATGLFDLFTQTWCKDALDAAGIHAGQLSEPVETTYSISGLLPAMAETLGISRHTRFITGASDGCLANPGSGAVRAGDMALTIGTSGALRMTTTNRSVDEQQNTFTYILSNEFVVSGGPINNGISLLKWFSEQFIKQPFQSAEDLRMFMARVKTITPGSAGLIFLPYVNGERAPVWNAAAKGVFMGLRPQHSIEHMMRAIVEGICFSLLDVYNSIQENNGNAGRIFVSGGFIQSAEWLQLLADIFGVKLTIALKTDASAYGAALLGWHALGNIADFGTIDERYFPVQQEIQPDKTNTEVYRKNFSIYKRLYGRLEPEFLQL